MRPELSFTIETVDDWHVLTYYSSSKVARVSYYNTLLYTQDELRHMATARCKKFNEGRPLTRTVR